jgi:broad specificity phosphatase PhoE
MYDWDVFISHASEDTETVARPLAESLKRRELRVWYDEHSLSVGDGLRRTIDDALTKAEFGVVVVSPAYLRKEWTMAELDGLVALQRLGRKVILPVWHGISQMEIGLRCPTLADLVAADTANGIEDAAEAIARAVKAQGQAGGKTTPQPDYVVKGAKALATYTANLISEIQNNLVLELYDKCHYEDICVTPLVRPLDTEGEVLDIISLVNSPRSVIIGEPGSGKTTALRMLALALLRRKPLNKVPIYLSLAAFGDGPGRLHRAGFADFVNDELGILGCESLDLLKLQPDTELVFLLDGWDEITEEEHRTEIKRYLNRTEAHFIATARPEVQRTLPAAERYEMYPLSLERIREFIRLRLRDDKQVEMLYRWISSDAAVQMLVSNPLNLSLLGIVFSEEGRVDRVSRTKLYDRAFDTILNQHHHAKAAAHDREIHALLPHIDAILQRLAYRTLKSGNGRFFSLRELQQSAQEELGSIPGNITDLLAGKLGVIRDRRSGRFEFFHLWYQEFLSAKYMLNAALDLVTEFGDPHIAPALPYAVGLLGTSSQADQLMRMVPIHDIFNFCRALPEGGFRSNAMRSLLERVIEFGEHSVPRLPVRVELAKALTQAGKEAVRSLFSICRSETTSEYARRAALESLSQMGTGAEFDELLLNLMNTASKGLLWHVIEHVGNRRIKAAGPLLEQYAKNADPLAAGDSFWALRQIGASVSPVPETTLSGLLACLSADDRHMQGHALRTLGRLQVTPALPALHQHLRNADSPYRWIVPEAAALIGGPEALAVLQTGLDDDDPRVRAASLKALGEISEPVPDTIVAAVEQWVGESTWIPFLEQSLGNTARNTLARLRQKRQEILLPTIYLIRHCKTAWNSEGRLQGTIDLELSAEGVREAEQNLATLREMGIQHVISSTAKRALQTAEVYARGLGVPIQASPRLRELDHGDWEGQAIGDLLKLPNSPYGHWLADPSASAITGSSEAVLAAQQRILEGVREVALAHSGETVLLVSHKHILAILDCGLKHLPMSQFRQQIVESTLPRRVSDESVRELRSTTASAGPRL